MEAREVGLAKVGIRRVYVMDEAKRLSVLRNSFWRRPSYSSTRGREPTCHCRRQQEMWVHSLGRDNPSEQEMATHSSIAWKIPWTEEADGLQSMGFHKVRWLSTHAESHSREGPTGAHLEPGWEPSSVSLVSRQDQKVHRAHLCLNLLSPPRTSKIQLLRDPPQLPEPSAWV